MSEQGNTAHIDDPHDLERDRENATDTQVCEGCRARIDSEYEWCPLCKCNVKEAKADAIRENRIEQERGN